MLVYEYTSGVPDPSPAGTAFDTARTGTTLRAQPTSRAEVWDAIQTALLAAGWTENNIAVRDSVFYSVGESGTEVISIRVVLDASAATNYLHFQIAPKRDGSDLLQGAIGYSSGSSGTTADRWSLSADATMDFQIRADLDSIWGVFQGAGGSGTVYSFFLGRTIRDGSGVNASVFGHTGALAPGAFVTITVSGGANPVSAGVTPGDLLQLVEVDPASPARAERAVVVEVTATTIVVDSLANDYVAARIGALASPLFRFVGADTDLAISDFTSPFRWNGANEDDLAPSASGNAMGFEAEWAISGGLASPALGGTGGEFGAGSSPMSSNLRFLGRAGMIVGDQGDVSAKLGRIPGLWAFNGTPSLYPHDWLDDQRASPVVQAVPFRFTSASTNYFALGPMPL